MKTAKDCGKECDDGVLSKADARALVKSMFRHEGLVRHHLESFNKFITEHTQHIVKEKSTIVLECTNMRHVMRFQDVHFTKPTFQEEDGTIRDITPQECMLRKQTYQGSLHADLLHVEEARVTKADGSVDWVPRKRHLHRGTLLCRIPVMTRSVACHTADAPDLADANAPYEFGGTFIISGGEKVLIPQEKLRINRVFVFKKGGATKIDMFAEIRSVHEDKLRSTSTLTVQMENAHGCKMFWVFIPYVKKNQTARGLPAFCVARLLGFRTMEELARCVVAGGRVSGRTPFKRDSPWMSKDSRRLYNWVMTVLKNETWKRMTGSNKIKAKPGAAPTQASSASTAKAQPLPGGASDDPTQTQTRSIPNFEAMDYPDVVEWAGVVGTNRLTKDDRFKNIQHLIANEFLPHLGLVNTPGVMARKRRFFAYILHRLALCAIRPAMRPLDDKDHYGNKQVETSGMLMSLCLRQNWRTTFLRKLLNAVRKEVKSSKAVHAPKLVSSKAITDNFKYALATGKWGTKKGSSTQTGVSQPIKRMGHMTWLAHLRRLKVPLNMDGKNPVPRQLRFSSYGISCPATTPEGKPCGLIKSLALGARVTTGVHSSALASVILAELGDELLLTPGSSYDFDRGCLRDDAAPEKGAIFRNPHAAASHATDYDMDAAIAECDARVAAAWGPGCASLLINGVLFGTVGDPQGVVGAVVNMRRACHIPFDTSVVFDRQVAEVYVSCDAGGTRRPLIVAPGRHTYDAIRGVLKTHGPVSAEVWRQCLTRGLVEYVGKHEEETALVVAPDPRGAVRDGKYFYTHADIDPLLVYGETVACIPFLQQNPAPRNTYQSSMGAAAVGVPGIQEGIRSSTHRLWYPEVPLTASFMENAMGVDVLPAGQNVMVAIFPHESNQEDSLVFNKAAIDVGLFRSFFRRTYTADTLKSFGVDAERFGVPDDMCTGPKAANYGTLRPSGFPALGTVVKDGDIIIGKQMSIRNLQSKNKHAMVMRDQSVTVKRFEAPSVVESVMLTSTGYDRKLACVRTRAVRVPEMGDKFASRCAQKGVMGRIVPDASMPFCELTGARPSVLMNPLTLPSRMTVGHLTEMLAGSAAALEGRRADGSGFMDVEYPSMMEALKAAGFNPSGKRKMRCGKTGKLLDAEIYMGPIFYQRLRQMADDKYHARARGQRQVMTRQATEGRAREGGFKLGEMERDCIAEHGMTYVMKDRFLEQSDDYIVPVCGKCGLIAEPARAITSRRKRSMTRAAVDYCRNCRSSDHVQRIRTAYNYKLLVQEAMGMNVAMRFELEEPRHDRDLETCASAGLHVSPEAEVTKPESLRHGSAMRRDPTLLTGAYASLVTDVGGCLAPSKQPQPRPPQPPQPLSDFDHSNNAATNALFGGAY